MDAQKQLLAKLFYTAINDENLSFGEFQREAERDENFFYTALILFQVIFENTHAKRKGGDYGLVYNELTFLAMFGNSGLPARVLDELSYFDVMEIFAIQGDLANPETYKYKMATPEERKLAFGITKQAETELEKFLQGGSGDGGSI
jgi:hypothetical protein